VIDNLIDKKILITGASSGIGRALALALARRGNRVIVAGRSTAALQELAELAPQNLVPLIWDVSDGAQSDSVRNFVQAEFGWLDIAILNAGCCEYIEQGEIDADLVQRVMAVNFFGAVHGAQALLPLLRRAPRRPYLLAVSSMSTYAPLPRAEGVWRIESGTALFF
jgi:NAD(P)-dependent dehydrogenase (short-subunit alcohol dehydrogenase family)